MSAEGRYIAAPHWARHAVYDQSWTPPAVVSTHDTEADAQAAADRLNTPTTPPQRTQQASLFDTQEVAP